MNVAVCKHTHVHMHLCLWRPCVYTRVHARGCTRVRLCGCTCARLGLQGERGCLPRRGHVSGQYLGLGLSPHTFNGSLGVRLCFMIAYKIVIACFYVTGRVIFVEL